MEIGNGNHRIKTMKKKELYILIFVIISIINCNYSQTQGCKIRNQSHSKYECITDEACKETLATTQHSTETYSYSTTSTTINTSTTTTVPN